MPGSTVRQRDSFLVFGAPDIREEEIAEVVDSMRSGWLGTGHKVARFEKNFREYKQISHAVAVNSCTAALHLSLLAAGVKPGDEVITTAMTFCATVNAILHAGATPVLVDIDPRTMNLDPAHIEARISSKTRAILPVHFAGYPCDMESIGEIASRHDLLIIEDCAHAIETTYHGRRTGTFGDFGCFSFYVTKNVITGEGGMIITPHADHAARLKELALHGMSHDAWARFSDSGYKHYQVIDLGFKYNMMDLQAAIGIHQLERVETARLRRKEIWERYLETLRDLPVTLPVDLPPEHRHSYHLFTILIDPDLCGLERDVFLAEMTARDIGVGVHYLSIPEHPFYQQTFGWQPEECPHAMRTGRQTVSLPLSSALSDEDIEDVIVAVRDILEG